MISAIIARGIGFGGVNYIPTHGFSSGAVVLTPRNTFPGETHTNTMTAAQRSNAFTGAQRSNQFAVVKHGSTEGGIE